MTRCVVQMNDGSHFNIEADRMEQKEDFIHVFYGEKLVGVVDLGAVISAYISKKGDSDGRK